MAKVGPKLGVSRIGRITTQYVFLDDLVASKRLSFFDVVLRSLVVLTVIVVVGVVFILIVERIKRWGSWGCVMHRNRLYSYDMWQ